MEKKFVNIINSADCGDRVNGNYFNSIQPLVELIFDGEINNHAIGYQISTKKNIDVNKFKRKTDDSLLADEYSEPLNSKFYNTDKLGIIETRFINFILLAKKRLIVLKGYRGTGKSELIKYVSNFMSKNCDHINCDHSDKCKYHKIKHIFIDFKEGECSNEHFKEDFLTKIFQKLGSYLRTLYSDGRELNNFINDSIASSTEYFFNIDVDLIDKISDWNTISNAKKYSHIFSWIENRFNNNEASRLDALYKMISFYNTQYPMNTSCFGLIIDNIDQLTMTQQNDVVEIAYKISKAIPIMVIIPTRLSTFNNINGFAGSNFWATGNMGYPPLDLCLLRIKHYREHKDDDYYNKCTIPQTYLSKFNDRLDYIYNKLIPNPAKRNKPDFDRLARTFEALAGVSIRKCLRLFRRLFLNYTIDWNDTTPKEDLLLRCLYSYKYPNGKMNPEKDNRVHNIFRTDKGALTLSKLRILNAVWESEENAYSINIEELKKTLILYGDVNNETFEELRASLWRQGKRIIMLVDIGTNEEEKKIKEAIVEITASGKGHIDYLCKDLQYIQNCFEVIDLANLTILDTHKAITFVTHSEGHNTIKALLIDRLNNIEEFKKSIPFEIDYGNFGSRIMFIRRMLRFLYLKDVVETIHYLNDFAQNNARMQQVARITNLLSAPIIIEITHSILNISQKTEYLNNERDNWIDFINIIFEFNRLLFPESRYNEEFENLLGRIEQENKEKHNNLNAGKISLR
jgi:hypothetical protein